MDTLQILTYFVWLVASVTFILALKFLASPQTARRGNQLGAAGMALVVAWTFFTTDGMLELVLITRHGIVIRQSVEGIRVIGRNTQGVRLINLDAGDMVMDVACMVSEDDIVEAVSEAEGGDGPDEPGDVGTRGEGEVQEV